MPDAAEKNRILSKISVAARTVLDRPKNLKLTHVIERGLSIRTRARLALAAAFLVATPTIFIGVMRTEDVALHASRLSEFDDYWKRLLETRIAIKELDLTIWSYSVEQELETGQDVLMAADYLKESVENMVRESPEELDLGPNSLFLGLALRLDSSIKRAVGNRSSIAEVRLNMLAMSKEIKAIEKRVIKIAKEERREALGSLSLVGRDQLILFLVLLFSIPIFVGFIPGWIIAPLSRLRQMAQKIEMGQIKDMPLRGRDEVALLARSLKSYFLRKEELDHKKSSKIFEMRNVLRSVINRVSEPVFIVDESLKINYTNERAANLLGLPSHQTEGKILSDCMYSPTIKKACEQAFIGHVSDASFDVTIEVTDGRTHSMQAKIGVVRNRDGEISRAVIVLFDVET